MAKLTRSMLAAFSVSSIRYQSAAWLISQMSRRRRRRLQATLTVRPRSALPAPNLGVQSLELRLREESSEHERLSRDDLSGQALQVGPVRNSARKRFGNASWERFGNGTWARWGHLRAEAQCMLSLARSLRSPRGLKPWSAGGWPHRHRRTTARIRRFGALLAAVVGIVSIAAAGWILAG